MHRFYDPRFSQILHSYMDEINDMEQREIDAINQDLPYSKQNRPENKPKSKIQNKQNRPENKPKSKI